MSLSVTPRLVSKATLARILVVRQASGLTYKPSPKQLTSSDSGFFKYERDISRDKRYSNPQKPGHEKAPWDWERIRNNYWNKPTLAFDKEGITHRRLEIMEALQDEMVSAAKARGTR